MLGCLAVQVVIFEHKANNQFTLIELGVNQLMEVSKNT